MSRKYAISKTDITEMMSKDKREDSDGALNPAAAHSEDVSTELSDGNTTESTGTLNKPNAETKAVDEDEVRYLRLHLKLYFFNAFKWKGDACSFHLVKCGAFLLQTIKIILITMQLFRFGFERQTFNSIVDRGYITLRHNLLQNWDSGWETPPYPPSHGAFASYNKADLRSRINVAVTRFYNIESYANGYFMRLPGDNMIVTLKLFDIDGFRGHKVNTEDGLSVEETTFPINKGLEETIEPSSNRTIYSFDVDTLFKSQNFSEPFTRLLSLELTFNLHSVGIFEDDKEALCLNIKGLIAYTDNDNKGQVIVDLNTTTTRITCDQLNFRVTDWERSFGALAAGVIVSSLISLLWTVIFVAFGIYLFRSTKRFMKNNFRNYYKPIDPVESDLHWREYTNFFRLWDVASITADVLTLSGTIWLGTRGKNKEIDIKDLDRLSIVLGIGGLLAWFSLLRFLDVHKKFTLLFNTFNRAFFNVLAYIVCAGVLFVGFWVCGFVVLAPYHVKFRSSGIATEALAALIAGDEIYATLNLLETRKTGTRLIWLFSRVYLWIYMAIFMIVILNLLVALFMSAYESTRAYYEGGEEGRDSGPVERALRKFVESSNQNPFRESIYDLLSNENEATDEALALRNTLSTLFRVSNSTREIILVRPRTLTAFMEEEDDMRSFNCLCMTCSFVKMKLRSMFCKI